ncbi:hypothetical protein GOP47_0011396 [Adiantum capillus-veneris]|uniref:Uncharacterized protein n=1 Tax=Adiantum capillus-veneris TaxID=13818 RepID=A0A9D4UU52_ADICA|nr:hypothetical protein GOP47_0011396 [Adiantum capillus-veneris]
MCRHPCKIEAVKIEVSTLIRCILEVLLQGNQIASLVRGALDFCQSPSAIVRLLDHECWFPSSLALLPWR